MTSQERMQLAKDRVTNALAQIERSIKVRKKAMQDDHKKRQQLFTELGEYIDRLGGVIENREAGDHAES